MRSSLSARDTLSFAFLVYPESGSLGRIWRARSVLTGHIAEGRTPGRAIDNLKRAIDAAMYAARRMGMTARQWHESQKPDDPTYLEAFARIVSCERCTRRLVQLKAGRCTVTIAKKAA